MRRIAEDNLRDECSEQRKKFRPAITVRDTMKEDPSRNRKGLRAAVKRKCREEEQETRREHLLQLPKQGEVSRIATAISAKVWADALVSLPPESSNLHSMRHTILFLTMQIYTCGRSLRTSVPSVGNARPSFMSSMHAILLSI